MTQAFFISPHLDDALFSAGGLMLDLKARGIETTVVNVFTAAGQSQNTLSAKRYLSQVGYPSSTALYAKRVIEDKEALKECTDSVINLPFTEALWRVNNRFPRWVGNILPELLHVYPTYRWHVVSGNISPADGVLIKTIAMELKKLISPENAVVFCPLGIGKHVDHLVVKAAVESLHLPTIYWEDIPYALDNSILQENESLVKKYFYSKRRMQEKNELAKKYISQYEAVLGTRHLEQISEVFHGSPDHYKKMKME